MKSQSKRLIALALVMMLLLSFSSFAIAEGPPGGPDGPGGGPGGPPPPPPQLKSSQEFTDYDQINNKEAVGLLVWLGIIDGFAGANDTFYFDPGANLAREQIAKILAVTVNLAKGEDIAANAAPTFSDTAGNWAVSYIDFGAGKGLINGVGGGLFAPKANVTVRECAKLCLAALGNEGLTGDNWAEETDALAEGLGLYDGIGADRDSAITRDDAALLIYNTILASDSGDSAFPQFIIFEKSGPFSGTISDNAVVTCLEGYLPTLVMNGVEQDFAPGDYDDASVYVTKFLGQLGSFGGGDFPDDYKYRVGLYVTEDGIDAENSITDALGSTGTYTDTEATGLNVTSTGVNFNGITVNGPVRYTIKDSSFKFTSDANEHHVNDFSGFGAVISALNGAIVTLDNVNIETTGVGRDASYTDNYAHTIIKNSIIKVHGGTLTDSYVNTADQARMCAPPWVLGITGNARGTNLMGNCSSTVVLNSDMSANQWGVVSSDSGMDMQLFIVDSTLTLLGEGQENPFSPNYGSGYGTYAIGNAQEYFRGVTFNVGTYATIIRGGFVDYASSRGTFDVYPLDADAPTQEFGSKNITGFGSDALIKDIAGQGKNTVVNSDAFGFMSHGAAVINIYDKTEVNTNNAVFLLKYNDQEINIDDASLKVKDGVILQMIDDDDSLVGADFSKGAPDFFTEYNEAPGWHEGGEGARQSDAPVVFNATNVTLDGSLYNGTGNYDMPGGMGPGGYSGNLLKINLGKGAILNGTASATAVMHVNEKGVQNTHFTIKEYYYLGHVANKAAFNGVNGVEVTLADGAIWNVTDEGIITSLTVGEGCTFNGVLTDADGNAVTVEAGVTYTGVLTVSAK